MERILEPVILRDLNKRLSIPLHGSPFSGAWLSAHRSLALLSSVHWLSVIGRLSGIDISLLERMLLEMRVSLTAFVAGYSNMRWRADGHRKTFTASAMWQYMSAEGYHEWRSIPRKHRKQPSRLLNQFFLAEEPPQEPIRLSLIFEAADILEMTIDEFITNVYRYAPDDERNAMIFPSSREDERYYYEPLSTQIRSIVYLACTCCSVIVPFTVKGLTIKLKNGWDPYLSTLLSAMDAMTINIEDFLKATETGDTFTLQPSENYQKIEYSRARIIEYIRQEYKRRNLTIVQCAALCSVTPKEMGRLLQSKNKKSISILTLKKLILPLNINLSELFVNVKQEILAEEAAKNNQPEM